MGLSNAVINFFTDNGGNEIDIFNLTEDSQELQNFARKYCEELNVIDVRYGDYSLSVEIESLNFPGFCFWLDYYIKDEDVICDWNQYIFNIDIEEDYLRSIFQRCSIDDDLPFREFDSFGFNYLLKNNYILEKDNKYFLNKSIKYNKN